jgi:hypothetical protein
MRVKLIGSRGITFELPKAKWLAALEAAAVQGWRWSRTIDGNQVIQQADANRLSQALRQAGRNCDGWPYLCEFLKDNTITIE